MGIPKPDIIEGVLFAHGVSKHTSTKFSSFFLMHNWEPTLPIDANYNLVYIKGNEGEHPFEKETFDAVLTTAISMRTSIRQTAGENSCSAQKYKAVIKIDAMKYLTRLKWVKKYFWKIKGKWTKKVVNFHLNFRFGSFTVHSISNKNLCSLINKDGTQIKTKCNVSLSKPYLDSDEKTIKCDINSTPNAIDEQSHDTEKSRSSKFNG